MRKIPDRFGRKDPLKQGEIEAVIQRFERAAAEDEVLGDTFRGIKCQACGHTSRVEIHRALLQGTTYARLVEKFKIEMTALHRHYYKHLMPLMRKEMGECLMDMTTRIEATRPFPNKKTQRMQYQWCLDQLDVVRRLQLEELDTTGKTKLKKATLNDYLKTILHIMDAVGLIHGKPNKVSSAEDPPRRETVEDHLTEEQKEVIAKAKKKMLEAKERVPGGKNI